MQASQDDIDISGMVSAIKRGLPRVLVLTGLAGVLTYGALILVPPTYKSTAQVILESSASSLLRPSGQASGGSDVKIDESEVASQAEVIRSRDLLSKVVTSQHLEANPEFNPSLRSQSLIGRIAGVFSSAPGGADASERALSLLEFSLKVGEVPKTRLINIDVTTHDATLAANLANAIAEAYLDRNRATQVKDASEATTSIGASIAEVKQETEAAETALERFRAESGLLSGQNNVTLNNQQLSELNTQLTQATAARTEAEARSHILREMIVGGRVEASQDVVKSPNMQQLFQQKLLVERDIAELSATLLPAHPRMRQLSVELEQANARLRDEAKQVAAGIEDDLRVAAARESALRAGIAQLTQNALKSSDAQAKLSSLEREAQSKRNTYDGLLQRLSEASSRRSNSAVSAMASLNERATAASIPDSPKKAQISIFAMLGAFLLGLVVAIARELLGGTGQGLGKADRPGHFKLKAGVTAVTAKGPKTIRLSGSAALAGYIAGRSTTCLVLLTGEALKPELGNIATRLAHALAAGDASTVLIDLTDGSANNDSTPGLAELAIGSSSFEEVVRPATNGNWHLIGPGSVSVWQESGMANTGLPLVFDALGAIYNFVVVVVADRQAAKKLVKSLGGRIGLGVICTDPNRLPGAAIEERFPDSDLSGLPVVWLDAGARTGRGLFTRLTSIRSAQMPV